MRKLLLSVLIVTLVFAGAAAAAEAAYVDIATNWAKEAITGLEEWGAFTGIFDEEYGPHQPLDTATFSLIAQRVFGLEEPPALAAGEDELVTRAVLITTAAEYLGLTPETINLGDTYPSFEDVASDHPVYVQLEALRSLGVLPTYIHNRFEPERPATRAEIAHLLHQVSAWRKAKGKISELSEDGQQMVVAAEPEPLTLILTDSTAIFSGGKRNTAEALAVGDAVFALYSDAGQAVLVSKPQRGLAALVDPEELMGFLNKAAAVVSEVLTPEQISAVLNGDWQALSDEVRYELHQRLVDLGVSPWEVDALLDQDWPAVQEIVKDRLAAEAADFLKVSPELVFAALNRNWDRLLEYAQVELAQRLLTSSWLKNEARP